MFSPNTFFTSPWTISIIAGIVSGIFVYFVTQKIFSKKASKEYLQKISSANNEVLYALRPSIAEKLIPKKEIIKSLINSSARKYGVLTKDMLSISGFVEDLIKEIMDSNFISEENKEKYTLELSQLLDYHLEEKSVKKEKVSISKEERSQLEIAVPTLYKKSTMDLSLTLAIITTLITMMGLFIIDLEPIMHEERLIFSFMLLAIITITLFIMMLYYSRIILKRRLPPKSNRKYYFRY